MAHRLVEASPMSLWDRMERLKLKMHGTCVKKVSVGNKVMKQGDETR